ncbi:UNVERIFIED_CONTAM: dhbF [Trichonephila clavipes]
MIEDSGIGLLLTQSHLHGQLPLPEDIRSLDLEGGGNWLEGYGEANLESDSHPENLAYMIYTSGSTGRPKGALLPHHNVIRLFRATQDWFHFDANDVWSIFHSYAFDFSVWELFGALLHGAKAIIVPRETARSPEDFHALLVRERVTILNQTPSAFKQLIPIASAGAKTESVLALRYVVFGGEALDVGSLQGWFECFGDQRPFLVNMYGITETTVHVTYRPLSRADLQQSAVSPIGEVITDLSWYLLDSNLNLVAPGCHGELYVGRAGLARGYHRRSALTAERFVPNPFDDSERGGGRLYRTGDLARCRADGVIDYIGRIDHQIKIRGFRIELGEIEAKLQEHPAVREAVVIDVEAASGKQLAAYLVLASTPEAAESEERRALRGILHDHLTSLLPDYMVPPHLVFIDGLPLTANGKLDRKALPKPEGGHLQQAYVAPGSELQQRIAAIWADLLKVERVGLDDNFFELGGHSLLLLTVKERIRQACGETLGINQLMLNPTVRSLAAYLESDRRCSVLVKLNGQENGVPLFLFHPSFGSVHCYKPLAMALRNERPVWGIVCRALVEIGTAVPSWQEMVDDYVEQILGVQSVGPYYLAGWSSGGNLAMDVAFELERSGRRVEFLGWIDAPPPQRITSFWQEVGIPRADSHHAGSFDDGQRDLLCIMFPEFAERINEAWSKLQNTPKSDDERMAEFSIWAQESLGSDFRRLCQELLEGGEYQVSWELKRTLDIRLQETDYKRVMVPPTCWWAAQSKTERIRDIIESSMRQGVGQQVESTIIDTTHVEIIKNPDFIRSFVSVLSQCYPKGS